LGRWAKRDDGDGKDGGGGDEVDGVAARCPYRALGRHRRRRFGRSRKPAKPLAPTANARKETSA
jgi:hypothetical protein